MTFPSPRPPPFSSFPSGLSFSSPNLASFPQASPFPTEPLPIHMASPPPPNPNLPSSFLFGLSLPFSSHPFPSPPHSLLQLLPPSNYYAHSIPHPPTLPEARPLKRPCIPPTFFLIAPFLGNPTLPYPRSPFPPLATQPPTLPPLLRKTKYQHVTHCRSSVVLVDAQWEGPIGGEEESSCLGVIV